MKKKRQNRKIRNILRITFEVTSARVASIASRLLQDPESATEEEVRILAASCLTQAPDKKQKRKRK